jgi:response regulator RpfG family c-di-GMP phosphodiesterase
MPPGVDWTAATVTVVDDEPAVRDVLQLAARSWQYECQAAESAEHAVQLLESKATAVVVTDLRMPGKGGIWLIHEIQRRWPRIGIIVLTAGDDSNAARECLNAGADRYFLKPVNLEEFRQGLEATLRTVRTEWELECYRRQLEHTVHLQMGRVRRTFLSAIDSLVRTLEARDPYTKGHSLRVRRYALSLGRALELDVRLRQQLSLAAKLHDIGKVGVPEDILNKPSPLAPAEEDVIRQHPQIGERILKPIIRKRAVLAAIRGHHERLDGRGYPDGLSGDQVPLLARIIAIADSFDALTTSRAYREAWSVSRALAELQAGAGSHFDPVLVRVFLAVDPGAMLSADRAKARGLPVQVSRTSH